MNLKELFEETTLLPIDKKLEFIDLLLDSIQNTDSTIQKEWLDVAQRRLVEIQSGKVQKVDSDLVFSRIEKRFR
jgi:hypothetical protein